MFESVTRRTKCSKRCYGSIYFQFVCGWPKKYPCLSGKRAHGGCDIEVLTNTTSNSSNKPKGLYLSADISQSG